MEIPPDDGDSRRPVFVQPAPEPGFWKRLRTNFLAGIVVAAPIGVTIFLVWTFVNFVDARVLPLIPVQYNPETYLPFSLPGLGVIVFVAVTAALGAFAKNLFGKQLFAFGERLFDRTPVVRSVYTTLKQIVETIFASAAGQSSFRQVCMIEYPRRGIWAVAFISTDTTGEIPIKAGGIDMVSVFLPTTPNPTSGFLLFVPREDVRILDMDVEEGAKLVISAGLVSPAWRPSVVPGSVVEPPASAAARSVIQPNHRASRARAAEAEAGAPSGFLGKFLR